MAIPGWSNMLQQHWKDPAAPLVKTTCSHTCSCHCVGSRRNECHHRHRGLVGVLYVTIDHVQWKIIWLLIQTSQCEWSLLSLLCLEGAAIPRLLEAPSLIILYRALLLLCLLTDLCGSTVKVAVSETFDANTFLFFFFSNFCRRDSRVNTSPTVVLF